MSDLRNEFMASLFEAQDYKSTSNAICNALDVLMNENEDINTSVIDCYIYDQNEQRGLKSPDTLRGRRSRFIIKNYIQDLVIASIKEEVARNGDFRIPENGKNDGLFDEAIIAKYEIEDWGCSKDDWDDYASFDISIVGNLKNVFEQYGCGKITFRAVFHSSHFSDCVEITEISDVKASLRQIEMMRDYDIPVDVLEELANHLKECPNKHLLLNAINYPG